MAHPIYVDCVYPAKADARQYAPIVVPDAAWLQANTTEGTWVAYVRALDRWYERDGTDFVTADDGFRTIVGPAGQRWKLVTSTPGGVNINAAGNTAGRATYDAAVPPFVYYDSQADLVYVKLSATSGDWSVGFPLRGPPGATAPVLPWQGVTSVNLNYYVPSAFATVQDAVNDAQKFIYLGTAVATIFVAVGRYALPQPIRITHPQVGKIIIAGPAYPTAVTEASFTGVKATDEAMLVAAYGSTVIFDCTGGFIECDGGHAVSRNILAIRTGAAGGNGVAATSGGSVSGYAMAMHGFLQGFYANDRASITMTQAGSRCNIASHCSGAGFYASNMGRLEVTWGVSHTCTSGYSINQSSFGSLGGCVAVGGNYGLLLTVGVECLLGTSAGRTSRFIDSGVYGVYLNSWCRALFQQSTEIKNAVGYPIYANQGSFARCDVPFLIDGATSGVTTTMIANGGSMLFCSSPTAVNAAIIRSPAVGTVGNANSYSG